MRMTMTPEEQFHRRADLKNDAEFEAALRHALEARMALDAAPRGLEQRLLARFAQAEEAAAQPTGLRITGRALFASAEIGKARRSAASLWTAVGVHAAAIALIAFAVAAQVHGPAVKPAHEVTLTDLTPPPPPPVLPKNDRMGGGGGHHDLTAATEGRLPRFSEQQIVPPMQPPKIQPMLPVEPTLVMQPDLKMASNSMVNLGDPNSNLKGVSLGTGSGTGVGSGSGAGMGTGSGGNTGGGLYHVGGSVRKPELIYQPEAEFSEEARKAKFSGNVEVYLWVDEQGNPSHIKVTRGVGMGLDEKAVEAVRQYKFKPATQNGKPVKVEVYIEVNFTIL